MTASELAQRTDVQQFDIWTRARGETVETATPELIAEYAAELAAAGYSLSTITRRLWSLGQLDRNAGREPRTNLEVVRRARHEARRVVAPKRRPSPPLTSRKMATLLAHLDETLIGLRNRALVLLLQSAGLWPAEIVQLTVADLKPDGSDRIRVHFRGRTHMVPIAEPALLAVIRWLQAAKIDNGYVFRRFAGGRRLTTNPLSTQSVRLVVQRCSIAESGRVAGFNARSARRGLADDLVRRGASMLDVKTRLRLRGLQSVSNYVDPAAARLGR